MFVCRKLFTLPTESQPPLVTDIVQEQSKLTGVTLRRKHGSEPTSGAWHKEWPCWQQVGMWLLLCSDHLSQEELEKNSVSKQTGITLR
jgi:hypothetical protein